MGDIMKYFVFGNNEKDKELLAHELSNYYKIDIFTVNSIDEMNEIVKNNKTWLIKSINNNIIEEICNLAETIIYLDYPNKRLFSNKDYTISDEIKLLLKKHIRKGIIIKSKKELNIYLKSIYESDRYIF